MEENDTEILLEALGTFPMITRGLLLQTGEPLLCHPVVIQIVRTFVRMILPCGLHLKAQESHLGVIWISLVELVEDSEEARLNLTGFVTMGLLKEGVILQETLKVTGCAIQDL